MTRISFTASLFSLFLYASPCLAQSDLFENVLREADRYARKHSERQDKILVTFPRETLGDSYEASALGFESNACSASEQFKHGTWCSTTRLKPPLSRKSALLIDGKLAYINIEAKVTDASASYLRSLARKLPSNKLELQLDPNPNQSSFVYLWGGIKASKLDDAPVNALAKGESPKLGILIDHLNDFPTSARSKYPIYSLGGTQGKAWIGNVTSNGRLTIRLIAYDFQLANSLPSTVATAENIPVEHAPLTEDTAAGEIADEPTNQKSSSGDRMVDSKVYLLDISSALSRLDGDEAAIQSLQFLLDARGSEPATSIEQVYAINSVLEKRTYELKRKLHARCAGGDWKCKYDSPQLRSMEKAVGEATRIVQEDIDRRNAQARNLQEAAAEEQRLEAERIQTQAQAAEAEKLAVAKQLRNNDDVVAQVLNYTSFGQDEGTDEAFWYKVPSQQCVYKKTPDTANEAVGRLASINLGTRLASNDKEPVINLDELDPRALKWGNQNMNGINLFFLFADSRLLIGTVGVRDEDRIKRGWELIYSDHCSGKKRAF